MSFDPVSGVSEALRRERLIPDVLPESFVPSMLFSVVYPGGKEVVLGNELLVSEAAEEPQVSFAPMNMPVEQADSDGEEVAYTLVMFDPDVPMSSNPQFRSFRHWVVSLIISFVTEYLTQAMDKITGLKSPADTSAVTASSAALKTHPAITPYRPPGPRPASGVHRYSV
jgi:phosphatidylethanolamine-binding protein